jgi:hypothetical protein
MSQTQTNPVDLSFVAFHRIGLIVSGKSASHPLAEVIRQYAAAHDLTPRTFSYEQAVAPYYWCNNVEELRSNPVIAEHVRRSVYAAFGDVSRILRPVADDILQSPQLSELQRAFPELQLLR